MWRTPSGYERRPGFDGFKAQHVTARRCHAPEWQLPSCLEALRDLRQHPRSPRRPHLQGSAGPPNNNVSTAQQPWKLTECTGNKVAKGQGLQNHSPALLRAATSSEWPIFWEENAPGLVTAASGSPDPSPPPSPSQESAVLIMRVSEGGQREWERPRPLVRCR